MPHRRHSDTRDDVDAIVQRHQLDYSLAQLRLVGLLLLALVLAVLLLAGVFAGFEPPLTRFRGMIALAPTLPLLPLGFCLYLVGGGHRRHHREQPWTGALHRSLLPLGLILMLVLPAVTLHDAAMVVNQRPMASLSPLEQHLLNPVRLISTLLLQGVTGLGLVLMQLRGRRQMQRVGLTPSLFFRAAATGPMQKHRRRSTDR